ALLPHVMTINERHMTDAGIQSRVSEIRSWIADTFGGHPEDAFDRLARWSRKAGLPGLDALKITANHRAAAATAAAASSSMKANPVPLPSDALAEAMEYAV
ncbi:MAG: alcohol dehydrogenase, partial [Paracoccaceae bacterium]